MANFLEAGVRYAGSVAGRSLGISAYRDQMAVFASLSPNRTPEWTERVKHNIRLNSAAEAFHQILLPTIFRSRAASYYMDPGIDRELYPRMAPPAPQTEPESSKYQLEYAARFASSFPIDLAQWGAVAVLSHSPLEVVAWKLAANAVTHVALDVIGSAAKRIKNFRPPASTLAA